MLELTGLLLTAGVFALVSGWRLLSLQFPHPADLATLSLLYYTLPLALLATVIGDDAGLVFLHAAAADQQIALQSMKYAILSIASLYVGRWLAKQISVSGAHLEFPLGRGDRSKAPIVIFLLLCLIGLGILLYGPGIFFSGYNVQSELGTAATGNALIYASMEFIGLTIGYVYLMRRAVPGQAAPKLVLIAIAIMVSLMAVRGKRLEVMSALIPIGVLTFATQSFFRTIGGRLLTLSGAAVLLSVLASLRLGGTPNLVSVFFNIFSEGLLAGHSLPGIIEKLNLGQLDYEYGMRALLGVLAFVPRFAWPGKDEVLYVGNEALDGVSPLGATNIIAEVLLQGGSAAVVIWFLVLGVLFERIHKAQANLDLAIRARRRLPAATVLYLVVVATFIPHFRDGIVPAVKIALQSLVFFYAMAGVRWNVPLSWCMVLRRRPPASASTGAKWIAQ